MAQQVTDQLSLDWSLEEERKSTPWKKWLNQNFPSWVLESVLFGVMGGHPLVILMCKSSTAQCLKDSARSSLIAFHRSVLNTHLMQPEMIATALGLGIPGQGPSTHLTGQAYNTSRHNVW